MAKQYTKCVSVGNFLGKAPAQVIIAAAVAALPVLFGAAAVPALGLVALAAIIAWCRWWLYGRLVCLGGVKCAVGWVSKVEPPTKKSGLDMFDTDYSFNLVLAPWGEGATQHEVENDGLQGDLIARHVPDDWDFTGESETQWANRSAAALHCEFEGGGVYDVLIAALAALPFTAAATVVCSIPIIGWVACAILGGIAALIAAVGLVVALTDHGDPDDVNPGLGEIHVNDPTGQGADILVVRGVWVYDSLHTGWNEIHPILQCQRIGTWTGSWSIDTLPYVNHWCNALTTADDPATVTAQLQPENQWQVHPVIDGCTPAVPPDDGPYPGLH
ncbi:MAG: hypothetical protein QOJ80_558 [Mycobacterium sp.]|jgi:hypothetical protein|nr:hypothetical protein [Mycobacterium sp.]